MDGTIEARGLVKRYGEVMALGGLDLDIPAGTILGLLGPNGAGKTTAVSILTTLVEPDEGPAREAGADVLASPDVVRERIGLSGQYAAVDDHLTRFENLVLIGRLYHLGRRPAKARAAELLERFSLSDVADRPTAPTPAACTGGSTWRAHWLHVTRQLGAAPVDEVVWGRPLAIAMWKPSEAGLKDVRDRHISRFGDYVGGIVLSVAVVGVLVLTMLKVEHLWIANASYAGFVAPAFTSSLVKLVAYRRGL